MINSKQFSLILITSSILLILFTMFSRTGPTREKEYSSENLKFTVKLDESYQIEEDSLSVILSRENNDFIHITRKDSNNKNLTTYLTLLKEKNNLTIVDEERITIDNLDAVKGKVNSRLIYFIHADGWIYTLHTDSPSLYDDIDRIAQSFQYSP